MQLLEFILPVVLIGTYVQCCGQQKQQQRPVILDRTDTTGVYVNTNPCPETSDFRARKPGEKLPVCTGAGQKPLPDVNTTAAPGTVIQRGSGSYSGSHILTVSPSGDLLIFNDTPEKDPPTLVRKQLESKQKASKKEK